MEKKAIELKNITKKFSEVIALDNVSFDIPEGKVFGLLGSNGAGKTTIINMLSGLLTADSGVIKVFGYDAIRDIETIRKRIAVVPQTISLYENLTVRENLDFFGGLYAKNRKELNNEINKIIHLFRLEDKENIKISKLSGGFKRRCSIGCALVAKPEILFLDEPMSGIDIYTNELIRNFVKSLKGVTIVFTTHSIKEAEEVCDNIIFLNRGKKILEGRPEDIINKYALEVGEKVNIKLDKPFRLEYIQKILLNANPDIKDLSISGKLISFRTNDLGKRVVDSLASLMGIKSHIINIDIEKPTLEDVFNRLVFDRR